MKLFRFSRVFPLLLALFLVSAVTEIYAQAKGRGGQRGGGNHAERGNRGGDRARGSGVQVQQMQRQRVQHPQQRRQQQAHQQVQQNRGIDRRNEMQQRIQQIQQQRVQQAQRQRVPQNPRIDPRAQLRERMQRVQQQRMQQIQQQRMQQAQQRRLPANRGVDRRAQVQERIQQIQQQRMQQAQQRRVPQNRGIDRRAQMNERMQLIQQRRIQRMQRHAEKPELRNDHTAEVRQRMEHGQRQGVSSWRGRGRGERSGPARERSNAIQPQIIPLQKVRNWYPQNAYRSADARGGRTGGVRSMFAQGRSPVFTGEWPRNYGQQRRAEVHQRNAERRAWRNRGSLAYSSPNRFWRESTYAPTFRPRTFYESYLYERPYRSANFYQEYDTGYSTKIYGDDSFDVGYSEPNYVYEEYDRPGTADIFRSVIFAVLGGGMGSSNDDAYYNSAYSQDPYWSTMPSYVSYNRGGHYPAGYSYATDPYYYDPYFYDDPHYAEVLPIQYFASDQPGGGLFRQLFTHLLAIGYDQGFQDGIAAREIEERKRVFYDPYAYENAAYDPYSVSLGDNRRCLSQGYELGYEDALNNINEYDQFPDGGVGLVSVLIGTVSQLM